MALSIAKNGADQRLFVCVPDVEVECAEVLSSSIMGCMTSEKRYTPSGSPFCVP